MEYEYWPDPPDTVGPKLYEVPTVAIGGDPTIVSGWSILIAKESEKAVALS